MDLTLADIDRLTGGKIGTFDVACPFCGPDRRSPVNRRREVMRVWRVDRGFATYSCARCGEKGHASERPAPGQPRPPMAETMAARAEARAAAEAIHEAATRQRLDLARHLWASRDPAPGTPAETYLRARGYAGRIPDTLGFLPARGEHPPAMIAGFGVPDEPIPGALSLPTRYLAGVHLTKLRPDGSGKAGTEKDKVMIGYSRGFPIVLAPMNDLLGLAVIEGIEKGLAAYQALGLGIWVAGAAARMPALAATVPDYADCVTIWGDNDKDGLRHARGLRDALLARRIHAELLVRQD